MGLMSFLALALFVVIASLVILGGREANWDHQQVVLAMKEPLPAPRNVRSLLRNSLWWPARIARFRQGSLPRKGPTYTGVLLGQALSTGM